MLYISRNAAAALSFLTVSLIIAAITSTKAEPEGGQNSAKKSNRVGLDPEIDVDNGLEDPIREKRMSNLGIKIIRQANLIVEGSAVTQGPSSGPNTVGNLHNGDRCDPNKGGCAEVARCAPNPVGGTGACVCKNSTTYGKECKQKEGSFLASTITPFQFASEPNSLKFLRYQFKAHSTMNKYEALMTLLKGDSCDPKLTPSADEVAGFFINLHETRPIGLKEVAPILAKATEMAKMGSLQLCDYRQFLRCDSNSSRCEYLSPGVVSTEPSGPEGKLHLFLGPGWACYEPSKIYERIVEVSCKWKIDGSCGHTNPGRCMCPDGFTGELCDEVVGQTTTVPSTEKTPEAVSEPDLDPTLDADLDLYLDQVPETALDPYPKPFPPIRPFGSGLEDSADKGLDVFDLRLPLDPVSIYNEEDIINVTPEAEPIPIAGIIKGYGKKCHSSRTNSECGNPTYLYCKPQPMPLHYIYQSDLEQQVMIARSQAGGSDEEASRRKRRYTKYQIKKVGSNGKTMLESEAFKIRNEEWKEFDQLALKEEAAEQDPNLYLVHKGPQNSCRCNRGLAPQWHKHGVLTCSSIAGSSCKSHNDCASKRCSIDDKTNICIKSIKGLLFMPTIYKEYAKEQLLEGEEIE